MHEKEHIEYDWPDTGKLSVKIEGNYSATMQFFPSKAAIKEAIERGKFCHSQASNSQSNNS